MKGWLTCLNSSASCKPQHSKAKGGIAHNILRIKKGVQRCATEAQQRQAPARCTKRQHGFRRYWPVKEGQRQLQVIQPCLDEMLGEGSLPDEVEHLDGTWCRAIQHPLVHCAAARRKQGGLCQKRECVTAVAVESPLLAASSLLLPPSLAPLCVCVCSGTPPFPRFGPWAQLIPGRRA